MFKNLTKAWDKISEKVGEWGNEGLDMLPNFLVAVLVFLGFVFLSRLVGRALNKRLDKISKNEAINGLIVSVFKITIIFAGLITCLGILHLDKAAASIIAGVGLFGLAFSFAFQHTAHDLLSGVIIATRSTIKVGDMIEANGVTGIVKRVGLRATYFENTEGQLIAIPNRLVTDENYVDYSHDGSRRVDIIGHIAYGSNLSKAELAVRKAVEALNNRKNDEPIQFYFTEMADYSIQFVVRFWMPFTNFQPDYLEIKHQAIQNIIRELDLAEVQIPFPITEIRGISKG